MTSHAKAAPYKHLHRLAWLAVALTLGVIVFGAFVRLSNAGLSCPDWPTCYGHAAWPTTAHAAADHVATAIRAVEPHKAWREQFHRMIAGALGVLVLALAMLTARKRRLGIVQVAIRAMAEPPGLSRPRWKVAILTWFSPRIVPSRPMKPGLSSLVM